MAEFLSAGVYIEERPSAQQAVQSVSTSTAAVIGWLPRGVENKPMLVGSLPEYFRQFGLYWANSDVPLAVTAFFSNGGGQAYVVRVCPTDAVAASVTDSASLWQYSAISRGTWGNLVRVVIAGNQNAYNALTGIYSLFDVIVQEQSASGLGDWAQTEFFEALDLSNENGPQGILTIVNDPDSGSSTIRLAKLAGGVPASFASTVVTTEAVGTGVTGSSQVLTGTLAHGPVAPFSLKILDGATTIVSDNGRGRLVAASTAAISGSINYATGVYSVTVTPGITTGHAVTANYITKGSDSVHVDLAGGIEGTSVTRAQISDPTLSLTNSGVYSLNYVDDMLSIALPDFRGDALVHGDVLTYCESRKDRFLIVDTKPGIDPQDAKNYKQVVLGSSSSYGAMYYPGIKVADPLKGGKARVISPVGHVAGAYARTDSNKNVGKAPAGTIDGVLNFSLGLERDLTQADRDLLYAANINPLISSTQTGRCIWGARTLQTTGDFNLVNVRRLFMYLEKSFFNNSADLVFEPLGQDLFGRVKLRFEGFLNQLTSAGYFASKNPAEAFRIVCDDTNNTSSTIASRQLICDVVVAAQTPAEFVRFRFQRSLNTLA